MRVVAEEHAVGGGQRQRVAGRFLPSQVLGADHQLLRLDARELGERPVGRLIAPDPLARGIHRIAAVALLIVAIVLVAVDHDLVADFPVLHLVAHGPDDARRVRPRDVIRLVMPVEGRDRHAEPGPDAVIVHASGHHEDQNLVAVNLGHIDNFFQHRCCRLSMALAADRPGMHLLRHKPHRRHLTYIVKLLFRRFIGESRCVCVESHKNLQICGAAAQNRFVSP